MMLKLFLKSIRHNHFTFYNTWRPYTCPSVQKKAHSWKTWTGLKGKGNFILMGNPGSGKTTTGKIVAQVLGKRSFDIDDDLLTPVWGTSVANKLSDLGEERFLEEEGQVLSTLDVQDTIVSLSGSNPLVYNAMAKIGEQGIFIYLDATNETILNRQKAMKVDRIVGMASGATLEDVINSRRRCYEDWYDIRVLVHPNDTKQEIAEKVLNAIDKFQHDPGHRSTRQVDKGLNTVTFLETVLQGIAPDGGLYVRGGLRPQLTLEDISRLVNLNYRERALRLLEPWIHPLDISPQELRDYINDSYSDRMFEGPDLAPVVHLKEKQYIQELFHGPTASFKDWALQLMPKFFTRAVKELSQNNVKYLILTATSGDTGSATLDGFSRHAADVNVGVMVLYPFGNISDIQRWQTTSIEGKNIHVVGVKGDFDFCQQAVKKIFRDSKLIETLDLCKLSAANSINWGRLLPQTLYHASAYLNLVRDCKISLGDHVDYCVPTGNFGNILSAFYVKEMGFPIRKLICASNENNILMEFLQTGIYRPFAFTLKKTISPSIDIIQSSNLERLLYHLSEEDSHIISNFYSNLTNTGAFKVNNRMKEKLSALFATGYATESNTKCSISNIFKETGYLMDPHTAVAQYVASQHGDMTTVISGTAHHGKFCDNILPIIDPSGDISSLSVKDLISRASKVTTRPHMNTFLQSMVQKNVLHKDVVPADYNEIVDIVVNFAKKL
uniref:Threonine synthase N-terminal domain-containing protein n=2 Tax=Biomphalaria glabrata TaxID=6526 RepID=A0A2C9M473_BIOGL